MGKYQIEYICGHTVTKELFGKLKDREHYIQWASTQECPECKQAKYNKKCQEMAEENNLPSLSGSDKQVVWAVAIRQTFLTNLQSLIDERMKKVNDNNRERSMATLQIIYQIRDAIITNETSAKWWIDKRYYLPQDIIEDYREIISRNNK